MVNLTLGAWNMRGLNTTLKRNMMNNYILRNKVVVMAVLETRIRDVNSSLLSAFSKSWMVEILCKG